MFKSLFGRHRDYIIQNIYLNKNKKKIVAQIVNNIYLFKLKIFYSYLYVYYNVVAKDRK